MHETKEDTMRRVYASLLVLAVAALGACTASPTTPPTTTISYANEVVPLLKSSCQDCHGANGSHGVSLFTAAGEADYAAIKGGMSSIIRSVQKGSMPPSGPQFTATQIKLLQDWQAGGSPQN